LGEEKGRLEKVGRTNSRNKDNKHFPVKGDQSQLGGEIKGLVRSEGVYGGAA